MSERDPRSQRRANASRFVIATLASAVAMLVLPIAAGAQEFMKCPDEKKPLLKVPEITRDAEKHKLQAVLKVSDQDRVVWFPAAGTGGGPFCAAQHLRFFEGYSTVHADETWPVTKGVAEPLPGPTFRSRVGDVVEISFLNLIDLTNFPNSQYFDRDACDEVTNIYPKNEPPTTAFAIDDRYPNCFHGSSTANLHFHGTHTNPGSTGDNVLLQIRPSPRKDGNPVVNEESVRKQFDAFFEQCESHLTMHKPSSWPTRYQQLPQLYRDKQKELLTAYDNTLKPGQEAQKLWPPNQAAIDALQWPQYFMGAYPYCFQLPEYTDKKKPDPTSSDPNVLQMGQAPGTQWYHMHKHGSTTLNVSNSLIGAFVIEGQYDDELKSAYKSDDTHKNWGLKEQVLVIQQLGVTPNMERGPNQQAGPTDSFSVNGRRRPVITMRPGEVQLWRIINGASRSGVYFTGLAVPTALPPAVPRGALQWAQTAQDGVQLNPANYHPPAPGTASPPFLMSAGNRVDLLVRAPKDASGEYQVQVRDVVRATEMPTTDPLSKPKAIFTLLTVNVVSDPGKDPDPEMPFVSTENFPTFPDFLQDIPASSIHVRRELTFNSTSPSVGAEQTINGREFGDTIDQAMLLNTNEEWKIINTTADQPRPPGAIMHPFHIHINPFQIVEVLDPWDPTYVFKEADSKPGTNCYLDPDKPTTWTPCDLTKIPAPFVWWDVFGMPGARQVKNAAGGNVVIPGYFVMRSRFADYPGQFVLHCHILAHEDRGMMQLIEVVPNTSVMKHH